MLRLLCFERLVLSFLCIRRWRKLVLGTCGVRRLQEHYYAVGKRLQECSSDFLLCLSHQYGYRLEQKRKNDGRPDPPKNLQGGPRRTDGEIAMLEALRRR